jgi:DNA-binding transcriptional ArsR family regulator
MPRAATPTDPFNAIAEPRRRQLIELLSQGNGKARAVGEMVEILGLPQPAVSKHLGVLRKVGLVTVAKDGQRRLYQLNATELKPVHDWVKHFERFWTHQAESIKTRAERMARERAATQRTPHAPHPEGHKES